MCIRYEFTEFNISGASLQNFNQIPSHPAVTDIPLAIRPNSTFLILRQSTKCICCRSLAGEPVHGGYEDCRTDSTSSQSLNSPFATPSFMTDTGIPCILLVQRVEEPVRIFQPLRCRYSGWHNAGEKLIAYEYAN